MGKDKLKQAPRRFSRIKRRLLMAILVFGVAFWLKRDQIQFRLQNLVHPIYGEIIFHADRDGDGIPQLYHLTFNTALRYSQIDQLTNLPEGAKNGVYSPDGTQIVFQAGQSLAVMNADGSGIHILKLSPPQPGPYITSAPYMPFWMSRTQIVFQDVIGSTIDETLHTCNVYAPFLFDLTTEIKSPLFELPGPGEPSPFGSRGRHYYCDYGNSKGKVLLPDDPPSFHPLFTWLEQHGFMEQAMAILGNDARLSPSGHSLVMARVPLWGSDGPSQIRVYEDGQWRTVLNVQSAVVSWSPDEQYLVYDALRVDEQYVPKPEGMCCTPPDLGRTWVIAFTSVDGSFTYPLLGNDGIDYFAPSWRP